MRPEVLAHYEQFPDPSPELCCVGPGQLDTLDENLHLGWSWARYRYTYRSPRRLRILDAGCGAGLSSLMLARLHPHAQVLGVDVSPRSIKLATARAEAAMAEIEAVSSAVQFQVGDLDQPLLVEGRFDFIVCRQVIHQVSDPGAVLNRLGALLDRRGMLAMTWPSTAARQAARQLSRAVAALGVPAEDARACAEMAASVLLALKPTHPLRQFAESVGPIRWERVLGRILAPLGECWDLEQGIAALGRAGLSYLYTGSGRPWQPERFLMDRPPEAFRVRVEEASSSARDVLMDALDPGLNLHEYRLYACPAHHEPPSPSWPRSIQDVPAGIERLIPHPSGLVHPVGGQAGQDASGPLLYRSVAGPMGPVDPLVDLRLKLADGQSRCGQIDEQALAELGRTMPEEMRRDLWMEMADRGFVLLEPPSPRLHEPCVHQGKVLDRLNCPCPHVWLRACSRYQVCTVEAVTDEANRDAVARALLLRGLGSEISDCLSCQDYVPDVMVAG